jgi:hypothetical protein
MLCCESQGCGCLEECTCRQASSNPPPPPAHPPTQTQPPTHTTAFPPSQTDTLIRWHPPGSTSRPVQRWRPRQAPPPGPSCSAASNKLQAGNHVRGCFDRTRGLVAGQHLHPCPAEALHSRRLRRRRTRQAANACHEAHHVREVGTVCWHLMRATGSPAPAEQDGAGRGSSRPGPVADSRSSSGPPPLFAHARASVAAQRVSRSF